jgi:formylmethanofuran dehydrogenase subunit D
MTLVAPRVLYDDGRLLREAVVVQSHIHASVLTISRGDAGTLGVAAGDMVQVSQNGYIGVACRCRPSREVPVGVVLLPRNLAGTTSRTACWAGRTLHNRKGGENHSLWTHN